MSLQLTRLYYSWRNFLARYLFKDQAKRFSFSVGSPVEKQNAAYIRLRNGCICTKASYREKIDYDELVKLAT